MIALIDLALGTVMLLDALLSALPLHRVPAQVLTPPTVQTQTLAAAEPQEEAP